MGDIWHLYKFLLDKLTSLNYNKNMIQMTVGELKAQFSSVLEQVMQGNDVQILYGRAKKPVARIVSEEKEKPKRKKRPLGLYKDCGPYWEDESFEITPEWLFADMDDLMF